MCLTYVNSIFQINNTKVMADIIFFTFTLLIANNIKKAKWNFQLNGKPRNDTVIA